jgi:hypothetical protein
VDPHELVLDVNDDDDDVPDDDVEPESVLTERMGVAGAVGGGVVLGVEAEVSSRR